MWDQERGQALPLDVENAARSELEVLARLLRVLR